MLDVIAFLSVAAPICVRRLCFVSIAWSPVVLVSPRGGRNGRLNRRLGRLNRQFSRSSRIELVRLSLVRIVVVSPQFRCYVVSIFVQPLPSSYRFMHLYFSESIGTLLSRFVCSIFIDNWHIDRCNDGLVDITFRYFGAVACFNIVFVSSIRLLRSSFILFTISLDRRAYNFSFDIACNIRSILSLTLRSTVRLTSGSTLRTTLRATLRLTLCLTLYSTLYSVLRWSSCFDTSLTHRCDSVSTSCFATILTLQWLCWLSSTYRDKHCSAGTFFTFFWVVRASYVRLPCTLFVEQSRYLEPLESRVEILGILGRRIIILSVFLSARCGHAIITVDSRRAKRYIYSATTRLEQSNHRIVSVRIVLVILVW